MRRHGTARVAAIGATGAAPVTNRRGRRRRGDRDIPSLPAGRGRLPIALL